MGCNKCKEKRIAAAKKARASQGLRPQGTLLKEKDVVFLRKEFSYYKGKLKDFTDYYSNIYSVSESTIRSVIKYRSWKHVS